MPKLVGRELASVGAEQFTDDTSPGAGWVRLTWAQALILREAYDGPIKGSMDTSDRGGPRSYAKRWYRWYAPIAAVWSCPRATRDMLDRASGAGSSRDLVTRVW